jgi:hypothetical protein
MICPAVGYFIFFIAVADIGRSGHASATRVKKLYPRACNGYPVK